MIKEAILEYYFPDYYEVLSILNSCSEHELELINDNLPEDYADIQSRIIEELQWQITDYVFEPFIKDWDNFRLEFENELIQHCSSTHFLSYNSSNNAYEISKTELREQSESLIFDTSYELKENVDIDHIVDTLNKDFQVKFINND